LKPLLLLLLIAFIPNPQQVERPEADLLVVKFGLVKEKQPSSSMIRGAQNPGGPITTPMAAEDRDLGSRKTDLRAVDTKAAVSAAQEKEVPSYQFRLELKNNGDKLVKGLIWEYQQVAGQDQSQPKQYLCALHVPPTEKKILDIWTPYLPQKVVSADKRKDPLQDGTVVINQIEYADGSVWKKSGWNYKLPADSLGRLTEGKCSVF
jgi:hypothetical protein